MTIDERLDRLAARHEALTQSVELLVHSQHEAFARYDAMMAKHEAAWERNDVAWKRNDAAWERSDAAWEKNDDAMAKTQTMLAQVVGSIDSLARIAHAHERRISDLEDGRT